MHTDLKPENILLVSDRSWEIDQIEDLPIQVNDANSKIKIKKKRDGDISYYYSSREAQKLKDNTFSVPFLW